MTTDTHDRHGPVEPTRPHRSEVARFAYRMRHHVLEHGRGAGPGLRRPGPRRRRHVRRRLRQPAPLPRRRPALGRTGPVPALDRPLRHRPVRRARRGRHRAGRRAARPTAPTTPGCRCRAWPATHPGWRSPAGRSATVCPSRSAWRSACATAAPSSRVYNFLSDGELERGLDLGGGRWVRSTTSSATSPPWSTSTPCRPTAPPPACCRIEPIHDKWAAFGWSVQRVDGNDVAALVAALDRADAEAPPVGRPSVVLCDTKIGYGVPLLENRTKAHFMRIDEDEWQTCRDQLSLGAPEGVAAMTPDRRQPEAQDLGDDRLVRRPGPEDHVRAVRARAGPSRRAGRPDRRPDRRPGQVHRHAHLRPGDAGPVLPDGDGRAAAARRRRRDGRGGSGPVRLHVLGVRRPGGRTTSSASTPPSPDSTSTSSAACPA